VTRNTDVAAGSVIKKMPKIRAKIPSTSTIHQGDAGTLAAVSVLLAIIFNVLPMLQKLPQISTKIV
jgi:hypothetical protein